MIIRSIGDARARLDKVSGEFASRFAKVVPQADLGGVGKAPGGEWVEITNAMSTQCLSLTPEHAIGEWLRLMNEYAGDKTACLYWRIEPDIDFFDMHMRKDFIDWEDNRIRMWKVYARVCIT